MQLNNFKPVPQLTPPSSNGEAIPDGGVNRRSAYAAMSDLQERFHLAGICTDQVWEYFKAEHRVDSRSKLTGMQWARISCNLQSARREASLFKILVDSIPDKHFRIHVYSDDPTVCIGRPRDIRKYHIFSEWGDPQQIANENRCTIIVKQGQQTTYYEPAPQPTPVRKSVSLPSKPTASVGANVRGEVLSPWGTVLEVRHA